MKQLEENLRETRCFQLIFGVRNATYILLERYWVHRARDICFPEQLRSKGEQCSRAWDASTQFYSMEAFSLLNNLRNACIFEFPAFPTKCLRKN